MFWGCMDDCLLFNRHPVCLGDWIYSRFLDSCLRRCRVLMSMYISNDVFFCGGKMDAWLHTCVVDGSLPVWMCSWPMHSVVLRFWMRGEESRCWLAKKEEWVADQHTYSTYLPPKVGSDVWMQDGSLLLLVKVTKWWDWWIMRGRTGTALEEH